MLNLHWIDTSRRLLEFVDHKAVIRGAHQSDDNPA